MLNYMVLFGIHIVMLFKLYLTGFKTIRLAESKVGRVSTDLSYVHNIKKKTDMTQSSTVVL